MEGDGRFPAVPKGAVRVAQGHGLGWGVTGLGVGDTSQEDKETSAVIRGRKIRDVTAEAKSELL